MIEEMIKEKNDIGEEEIFQKTFDKKLMDIDRISCCDGNNYVFAMQIGYSIDKNMKLYACTSNNYCDYSHKQNNLKICNYISGK
jgi:hypothetical protein